MSQVRREAGTRPIAGWGNIVQLRSAGFHEYRAMLVRLERRLARRHQYMLSYTLAKETNEGPTGTITDFYNPGLDRGPGGGDRRHSFVASGSVVLPYGISLGGVWTLRSTTPFSARAGIDLNNDGAAGSDMLVQDDPAVAAAFRSALTGPSAPSVVDAPLLR